LIQRLAEDDKPLELPAPTETKEDGVPLAAAIYAFNEQWGKTKLGKDQPPLTEQEVLAATEDWKTRRIEAPVTNSEFASLQQITDTRLLPTDTSFELLTSFRPGDGYTYDRWSIRILTPRTAKPGWTYAYEIRDRFLGVRKADESDDEGIYDEYRILPGSGLPRGPYQRRPLGASKEGGSTASPEERKSEEEIEKVVGTWVLAGTEDDEEPETIEVERNGYSITLKFTDVAGDRKNALVNLSPSDDPPRFDLADLSLSGAPTWVGNYQVEGDTLSLEFTGVSGLRGRPLNWPQIQKLDDSPRTFKGEYRRQAKSKMDE
jgi:hypothetical protein